MRYPKAAEQAAYLPRISILAPAKTTAYVAGSFSSSAVDSLLTEDLFGRQCSAIAE